MSYIKSNFWQINKAIAAIVIIATVILLIFLFLQNLVWSGQLQVATDFKKFTPDFSVLKPQENMVNFNYIKAGPVYFDLYLPRDFAKADMRIKYRDENNLQMQIGMNTKTGFIYQALKGGQAQFDLSQANINQGKLRFALQAEGLGGQKGVEIENLQANLSRPGLFQESIIKNLSEYFKYVESQH